MPLSNIFLPNQPIKLREIKIKPGNCFGKPKTLDRKGNKKTGTKKAR